MGHTVVVEGYDSSTYGERFADVYDDWYGQITDTDTCVEALASLAGAGPVLELGVGTGRLALPLADRGLDITGVDSSAAMLAAIAAKPGGDRVRTILCDMTDPPHGDRPYALAFVAYNTLFNLTEPGQQQRCLANTAALLDAGGRLVVEAFVPDLNHSANDAVVPREMSADHVVLSISRSDPSTQAVQGQYVDITAAGITLRPWQIRWATVDQIDEMAATAGLTLEHRWSGWDRTPFVDDATAHVSIYIR